WEPAVMARAALPRVEALAVAGNRLFAAAPGKVLAFMLPLGDGPARPVWEARIEGRPVHLLADEERLFVSTRAGRVYCFAPGSVRPLHYPLVPERPTPPADEWTSRTAGLLERAGTRAGYCIAWGAGSGRLIEELLRQSDLHVVVV